MSNQNLHNNIHQFIFFNLIRMKYLKHLNMFQLGMV